jgi:predicted transcriptional regulator
MLVIPAISLVAGVSDFQGGQKEATVGLAQPSFETSVNLSLPSKYYILNATLNVTGLNAEGDPLAYPENVSIVLNNTLLWAFNGTGYGSLGRQDRFSDGKEDARIQFGASGGKDKIDIKLPKGAVVQNATVEIKGSAPRHWEELMNITGAAPYDGLCSCACAGDVNKDGYDDIIVGAIGYSSPMAGYVYLFYGGPKINSTPDIVFTGTGQGDCFGAAVDGAGDVNGDGYDDVIIGAPLNDSVGEDVGQAYVFFGGPAMDAMPDVIMTGETEYNGFGFPDEFGIAVSQAGDVNSDGFDDVIVGAVKNDANGYYSGRAYIFYGSRNMDNVSDVVFTGNATSYLGSDVSEAGDVNNDGYDDVIVGAVGAEAIYEDAGQAYIYYGGKNMDNVSDVTFSGNSYWDYFGTSVACAGDVNGDGYDDVVVGAEDFEALSAGRVEVFFGGRDMDNKPDIVIRKTEQGERFGQSVAGVGDVNHDGYDDIMSGAGGNWTLGQNYGQAYIFYGGREMDNDWDVCFNGTAFNEWFGTSVHGAGDVNKDGYPEVMAGTSESADRAGRVYLFSQVNDEASGLLDPSLSLGLKEIWNKAGFFSGKEISTDFSGPLNDFLRNASVSGNDTFGNAYVDIPLIVSAWNGGNLSLQNLNITYNYSAQVPDFAKALNDYITAHKNETDENDNISVPLKVRSESAGRIRLSNLQIRLDLPPSRLAAIGNMEMDEDTANSTLVDLYSIFDDDVDSGDMLEYSVVSATNSSFVAVTVSGNRYISADALTGPANDNWTGTVEAVAACKDRRGQVTESDRFTIRVRNVNDFPLVTSSPALVAEPGVPYVYNVTADDGDNDMLRYSLTKAPANMTIDPGKGTIEWLPRARGTYEVNVALSDGASITEHRFNVSVPNRIPVLTSKPSFNATVGSQYTYLLTAEDANLDPLNFSLLEGPVGMNIQSGSSKISWTPGEAGDYKVVIEVWDGEAAALHSFTIKVARGNQGAAVPIVASGIIVTILIISLIAVASTEIGKYKLMGLFIPLYTRLHGDEVLDNETRGMIRGCILSDPGIHLMELRRRLALTNGSAVHHLQTLEREGIIQSSSDGRLRRFYPAGMKLVDMPLRLSYLQKGIFNLLRQNEGMSQKEMAIILDVYSSTVHRQVRKMAAMGVLRLERHGMTVKCYINEEWRARIEAQMKETPAPQSGLQHPAP